MSVITNGTRDFLKTVQAPTWCLLGADNEPQALLCLCHGLSQRGLNSLTSYLARLLLNCHAATQSLCKQTLVSMGRLLLSQDPHMILHNTRQGAQLSCSTFEPPHADHSTRDDSGSSSNVRPPPHTWDCTSVARTAPILPCILSSKHGCLSLQGMCTSFIHAFLLVHGFLIYIQAVSICELSWLHFTHIGISLSGMLLSRSPSMAHCCYVLLFVSCESPAPSSAPSSTAGCVTSTWVADAKSRHGVLACSHALTTAVSVHSSESCMTARLQACPIGCPVRACCSD